MRRERLTMIVRVEQYDASVFYILVPTYVDYSEKIQFKLAKKDTFNIKDPDAGDKQQFTADRRLIDFKVKKS